AQITSAITALHDEGVTYRGHAVTELAVTHTFEQVAELLWTGELPGTPPVWRLDSAALARCRAVVAAAGDVDPITALILATHTLAATTLAGGAIAPGRADAAGAARTFLALVPSLFGGAQRGDVASRLAGAWRRRPPVELVTAISCAL